MRDLSATSQIIQFFVPDCKIELWRALAFARQTSFVIIPDSTRFQKVQEWFSKETSWVWKQGRGLLAESSWSRCSEWTNRTWRWRSWKTGPIWSYLEHAMAQWSFRNSYIVTCPKIFWGLFFSGSVLWQAKDKGGCILFKGICTSLSAFQTGVWSLSK